MPEKKNSCPVRFLSSQNVLLMRLMKKSECVYEITYNALQQFVI